MTVMKTHCSHRATYLVLLLVFAVALSTALLLAADREIQQPKKSTSKQESSRPFTNNPTQGSTEWAAA
jgi:hypothetical protein